MARIYKAFCTFICDRCNCKQSVMSEISKGMQIAASPRPEGWARIDEGLYCEGCTKIIRDAMAA